MIFQTKAPSFPDRGALFCLFYHITGIFSEEFGERSRKAQCQRQSRTAHCPESRLPFPGAPSAIATWTVQRQPNPGLGEWVAPIARKNI
ncbi:hypothetical protein [Scytonema sp. PRP1]|uniref:hypothetical protein n=1 Tax=Scytonema sp. PRP1 TaxID=3120513 RepID=UPI002FD5175B